MTRFMSKSLLRLDCINFNITCSQVTVLDDLDGHLKSLYIIDLNEFESKMTCRRKLIIHFLRKVNSRVYEFDKEILAKSIDKDFKNSLLKKIFSDGWRPSQFLTRITRSRAMCVRTACAVGRFGVIECCLTIAIWRSTRRLGITILDNLSEVGPSEVWTIMEQCWMESSEDRLSFKQCAACLRTLISDIAR